MPLQIQRPLILFAIIVVLFLVARHFLMPESFGEKGFYRGKSLVENADKQVKHVGSDACADCHDDVTALRDSGVHKDLFCEVCHNVGYKHIESGEATDIVIPNGRIYCGWCHATIIGRSDSMITQIDINEHNIDIDCIECHNPHEPWK